MYRLATRWIPRAKLAWLLSLFIYFKQCIINNVMLEGRINFLPTPPRKQRMKSITTQATTSTLRSLSTLLRLYLGPLLFIRALLSWPKNNKHTCYVWEMWCWWPNSLCARLWIKQSCFAPWYTLVYLKCRSSWSPRCING